MTDNGKQNQGPAFGILRIYTKDVSFESPMAPEIFLKPFQPKIEVRVEVKHREVQAQVYEVTLEFSAEAKDEAGEVGFIVEVEQAGLFELKGFGDAERHHAINVFCPNNLFPYIRQVIDQCLVQGGMPPLALAPINFDAIYQRQQASAAST